MCLSCLEVFPRTHELCDSKLTVRSEGWKWVLGKEEDREEKGDGKREEGKERKRRGETGEEGETGL